MSPLLNIVGSIAFIAMLVCFIMVVVKTFQNGRTGAGVAQIITFFVCCVGLLVGLIYGWTKAEAWRIKNLMIVYTACFLIYFGVVAVTGPAQYQAAMEMIRQQQQQQQQGAPGPVLPAPTGPAPVEPGKAVLPAPTNPVPAEPGK